MALNPISTETEIKWLHRVTSIPFFGEVAAIAISGFPLGLYTSIAEMVLHTTELPAFHSILGGLLAGGWALCLWYRLGTRIRIFWIPTPILFPLLCVARIVYEVTRSATR